MNNTPETDALVSQFLNGGEIPDISAHCRKLEQERDEAREHLSAVKHFLNKYIAERDDARKDSEYYQERYAELRDERDKGAEMCTQYKRERGSAWAQEQIHYDNYIAMKKERDDWKNKAHSYFTDYTLMEAKCFRLEHDQLKS